MADRKTAEQIMEKKAYIKAKMEGQMPREQADALWRQATERLCAAGGLALLAAGEGLTPVYLRLVRTPEALTGMASAYLRIYFLAVPAIVFYNLCAGMLRSLGDSRSTLVAQVFGGLLNVAADWLFIARFGLGVAGAAWATLISQTVSAAYVVFRLTRLEGPHALRFRRVRFDRGILAETARIGVPAGVQALVITLSNVAAQYHINRLGESAIAAFTAYFKVELLVYYPMVIFNLCLVRTALLFCIAPRWRDVRAVAMCYPITWAVTGACMLFCWLRLRPASAARGWDS